MTSSAIAAMLSTILYGKRFFPYYVYNIIGGLDEHGGCRNAANVKWSKCITFACICSGLCTFNKNI